MPLTANLLERASIFRNSLAYQAIHQQEAVYERFAIPFAYTLFVTMGRGHCNYTVRLVIEIVKINRSAQAMLFAAQPPASQVDEHANFAELTRINKRERSRIAIRGATETPFWSMVFTWHTVTRSSTWTRAAITT